MSEFDELFNSIQKSNIVDIIRDSKIELVTEFDADHPLKTGEYFYDESSNTLYVGAGLLMGYSSLFITDFLSHRFSIRTIEAPRIMFRNKIPELIITHDSTNRVKRAPKLYFSNHVDTFETIYHDTSDRVTFKLNYRLHHNIDVTVEHRLEVI